MLVRVIRPFCIAGRAIPADQEVDIPDAVALEAIGSGRAARAFPAEVSGPMTTATTGALVEGKQTSPDDAADDAEKPAAKKASKAKKGGE